MDAADGDTVPRCVGTGTGSRDIRFSPDGTLVGSVSDDGELIVWDTATGRPLERWDTFDQWGVGFSPDNDLVYGGGGDSMLRTWDLSVRGHLPAADDPGRRRRGVRARRPLPGRAAGGLSLARRQGQGMGQVRRHRHRRSDAARPACRWTTDAWPCGTWHPEGGQYVAYGCDGRARRHGIVTVLDSATGKLLESGTSSTATATSGRWRTSTGTGACSWATPTAGPDIVDAETLRPRGEPFDVRRGLLRHPDRGREHRDGLRGLRRRRRPSTGG